MPCLHHPHDIDAKRMDVESRIDRGDCQTNRNISWVRARQKLVGLLPMLAVHHYWTELCRSLPSSSRFHGCPLTPPAKSRELDSTETSRPHTACLVARQASDDSHPQPPFDAISAAPSSETRHTDQVQTTTGTYGKCRGGGRKSHREMSTFERVHLAIIGVLGAFGDFPLHYLPLSPSATLSTLPATASSQRCAVLLDTARHHHVEGRGGKVSNNALELVLNVDAVSRDARCRRWRWGAGDGIHPHRSPHLLTRSQLETPNQTASKGSNQMDAAHTPEREAVDRALQDYRVGKNRSCFTAARPSAVTLDTVGENRHDKILGLWRSPLFLHFTPGSSAGCNALW